MPEIEFCLLHRKITVFLDGKPVMWHCDLSRPIPIADVLRALGYAVKEGHVYKDWEHRLNGDEHDWSGG